jgi:serine/threonine-protein kinase HipA
MKVILMADLSVLEIFLHEKVIGTLTLLAGDRSLFAFNQAYIDDDNRPTLSLSFKDALGGLITDIRPTQTRVAPFFANLLPEGPMRDYLAQRAKVNSRREFFLLWVLGQDLPGALVIRPADSENLPPEAGGADQTQNDRDSQGPLRFSLAGVQLKFSAVMDASGGLTIPVKGIGGSWIIKLPSSKFDNVPENEYAMMSIAREIGIDIPEIKLIPISDIAGLPGGVSDIGKTAFVIKRFDRSNDGAIHMEDFAQVFGIYPDNKYEHASYKNIAEVIWVETGELGIAEFIRRLVFNTLIGNADMHLKNWSLVYPNRRNAALAPGYDFVSTIAHMTDNGMALNYARTKRFAEFSKDELSYLAAKAKLPGKLVVDTALETVERFYATWRRRKTELGLPQKTIGLIDEHIKRIPLAGGR